MGYGVESEYESMRFIPTIASGTLAPTVAEWAAGTEIGDDAAEIGGFTAKASFTETPTLKAGFVPKITGKQRAEDSSVTMDEHTTFAANTIKSVLAYGVTGFIGFSRYKKSPLIAADKVDIFPIRVGGNNRTRKTSDDPMQYVVDVGITAPPGIDLAVLA